MIRPGRFLAVLLARGRLRGGRARRATALALLSALFGVLVPMAGPAHAASGFWQQPPLSSSPQARSLAAMAYDPSSGQVVLFGGNSSSGTLADTWVWTQSGGWQQQTGLTDSPEPRNSAAMAYDPGSGQLILFGGGCGDCGTGGTQVFYTDTWAWTGTAWVPQTAGSNAPGGRDGPSMAYDTANNRILLFGGTMGSGAGNFGDTWAWTAAGGWTQLAVTGPPPRAHAAMADDASGQPLLFGGASSTGLAAQLGDTWRWDGSSWTQVASTGPAARFFAGMAFDGAFGEPILFGGFSVLGGTFGDTWAWTGSSWTEGAAGGPARQRAGMAYDAGSAQLVLFGGGTSPDFLGDTWVGTDTTPPGTNATPSGESGNAGWWLGPVSVSLTAGDVDNPSTSLTTFYAVDNSACASGDTGACSRYSGPIPVGEGVHTLYFFSVDPFGNAEAQQQLIVKVDSIAPSVTNPSNSCDVPGANNWCRGTETANFAASDTGSGVASPCSGAGCTFTQSSSTNGSAISIDSGPVLDVAGNRNPGITAGPFKIDSVAPGVSCQVGLPGPTFTFGQSGAVVLADVSDGTSGPAQTPVSAPADVSSGVGSASVTVTGLDNAGNSTSVHCPYTVIKAGQTITFAPLSDVTFGVAPFTVSATGGASGNPVTFTADPAGVCTASGANGSTITVGGGGTCTVTANQAGNDNYNAAPAVSWSFKVNGRPTTLTYTGPTTLYQGDFPTLSARLTLQVDGSALPSESITMSIDGGGPSCTATTDASGDASCVAPIGPTSLGFHNLTTSFTGDANDQPATVTTQVLIKTTTKLIYTGALSSDYDDPAAASAVLLDYAANPVSGEGISFTLNGTGSCSGTTDANGAVLCLLNPNEAAGSYPITASFGGDLTHDPSTTTKPFTVNREETTTTYTGPTVIANGSSTTLSATLKEDGTTPISGRSVTLTLGPQSCIGTTSAAGVISCAITVIQPLGPETLGASFAGDGNYLPSSATGQSAMVFAWPSNGAFVLGDKTVAGASQTTTLTFWSSSWSSLNLLSGGPTPSGFKGFANMLSPTPAACGGSWTTNSGNSPPPPSTVPTYMGVIVAGNVTTSVSKKVTIYEGNVLKIAVIKTNAGFSTGPGHTGTGTLATTTSFCG